MRKLSAKQSDLIERTRKARRERNNIEVDYLWEEMKSVKTEMLVLRKQARVRNLEGITLKRYMHGLERIERSGDRQGAKRMIERIRNSGLDAKLAEADINEREYLAELQETLDEFTGAAEADFAEEEDAEKLRFLAEIDGINEAEDEGDVETAAEREARLRAEIEDDEPRERESNQ
jgi:hypothetical protein